MGHFVKSEYKNNSAKIASENLSKVSNLLRCLFLPIIESVSGVMDGIQSEEEKRELQNYMTRGVRDVWGYALVYRGFSEEEIEFRDIFDPDQFFSVELMHFAYFVTPALIVPSKGAAQNALLDPEYPPEIIDLLKNNLIGFLSKKYKNYKSVFHNLPEDMIILLGEIEFVTTNQLIYLKNSISDPHADHRLPNIIEDIFYYLTHDDITALKDMVQIISAQAEHFFTDYFNIVLSQESISSYARDIVCKDISLFVTNICDDSPHVVNMINKYPYMFLWKPVLNTFIKVIDQLAHIKYLEYGKVPEISYSLRKVMKSDKQKDAFGELIKKCKRLTLFALN